MSNRKKALYAVVGVVLAAPNFLASVDPTLQLNWLNSLFATVWLQPEFGYFTLFMIAAFIFAINMATMTQPKPQPIKAAPPAF